MKIKTSKKFRIDLLDFLKSLIIAGLSGCAMIAQQLIDTDSLDKVNWKAVLMAFVGGCLSYLIKNFFTPTRTIIKDEQV